MHISDKQILKEIHIFFKQNTLTLSLAESCTGGLIASMITDLPGASEFFDSGIAAYSNESKMDLISVNKMTIKKYGAVSEETARQMAAGVRRMRKTNFSLAVTGNLGPSVVGHKERGLVYFAVASEKGTLSREIRFSGTRKQIKKQTALAGLSFLLEVVTT